MPRQRPPAAPLELPRGEGAGEALAAELKQRQVAGATFAALAEALCSGAEASLGGEGTPGGSIVEGRAGQSVADGLLAAVEAFIAQGIVGGPLVHVTLESLERVCAVERPRRAFSATRQAPHVGCAASRRRAARMVASAAAMSNHVGGGLAGGGGKALEPRAVARLAHAVGLTREDLVHHGQEVEAVGRGRGTPLADPLADPLAEVAAFAERLLASRKTAAPAVTLALTFELEAFAEHKTLERLLEHDADELAESLAGHLEADRRHHLVRTLLERELYKPAHRCCGSFGLSSSYPQAKSLYYRQTITKLAAKGRWEIAIDRAGDDAELQRFCVELRAATGDADEAARLQARFGFEVTFTDAERAAGSNAAGLFLPLGIARDEVRLVSDEQGVRAACEWLRSAEAIGLDSEWRPTVSKGRGSNPVALLQLSCARRSFLFDMVTLRADEALLRALDEGLVPLMSDASIPKLGYAVLGDFSKLRGSYALRAFHEVRGVVDVGEVHTRLAARRAPGGLAGLCKTLLGKPLDKSVTCSNWEQRPLSERQILYAANDAHCCVRIWAALREEHGAEALREAAGHATASSVAPFDPSRAPFLDTAAAPPPPPLSAAEGEAAVLAAMRAALPESKYNIRRSPSGAGTMADVAMALGVSPARVVKSIACVVEDAARPGAGLAAACLLLLSGAERANLSMVAARLGIAPRALRLCTPNECCSLFGFRPGTVPAVGLRKMPDGVQLTVLMSESVSATQEAVFVGGGSLDSHVEIAPADLLLVAGGHVAPIVGDRGNGRDNGDGSGGSGGGGGSDSWLPMAAYVPPAELAARQASGSDGGPQVVKFVADGTLGRLVRWLRCLGVDTEAYENVDRVISCAAREGRHILTRQRRLAGLRNAVFLKSNLPKVAATPPLLRRVLLLAPLLVASARKVAPR